MKLLSKRVSFICLGMMATGLMQAQAQSKIKFRLPTLGVHAGSLSFPTGHAPENWSLTNARPGYSFELNEQFSNSFSASFSFLTGSLAGTGTSADPHLSFESKINLGGLNFYYHFANDVLIKSTAVVNPYFGAGIGFLSYKTFADLKDNAGNTYYYWSDGSIRNIDEHDDQAYSALKIKKDKIAETPLQSLPVNGKLHPTTSLAIPLHAGLKFSIAPSLKFLLFYNDRLARQHDQHRSRL
jgi:hypothetical protein